MIKPGHCSSGFTLIEVLIATVIMFSLLTTAAMVFKSARLSSEHAADVVSMVAPLPFITDTIREQIRQNPAPELNGDGKIEDIEFYWTATSTIFLPPPEQIVVETMQQLKYKPRFHLYEVTLKLQRGKRFRDFFYKELAWLPQVQEE